nr:hypothetical protein [uncultured Carboxylicivirga sp.]
MLDKSLVIFKINLGFLMRLRSVVALILGFLISAILTYKLRTESETLNLLLFFSVIILIYVLAINLYPPLFDEVGQMRLRPEGIQIKQGNTVTEKHWESIKTINFYYRGDLFWRARRKKYQKLNYHMRYSRYRGNVSKDEEFYDLIEVDGIKYLVKIRDHEEKNLFMTMYEEAKQNISQCRLYEHTTYREYIDN